jgi:PIN domain nuclease of toxin-antitoxin system
VNSVVLDASSVLALLNEEPGSEVVKNALTTGHGVISSVNLAETATRLMDWGAPQAVVEEALESLELKVADFTVAHAFLSAGLRASIRRSDLSL